MPVIRRIIQKRDVVSVPPSATVDIAVQRMASERVGSILVYKDGVPVGIFTERDLLNKVAAKGIDPRKTPISAVMSKDVVTVDIDDSLENCYNMMQKTRCRHIPIVEEGKPVGMVTMRDILERMMEAIHDENRHLKNYIQS